MIDIPKPVRVKFKTLNMAPYNPRVIDDEEMSSLKASLNRRGLVETLVVQKQADDGTPMVLIGGHQRVRGIKELCEEKGDKPPASIWAVVLDIPDREAKQLNIALNRIGGEFDVYKLAQVFASIPDLTTEEVTAVGYNRQEVDDLIASISQDPIPDPEEPPKQKIIVEVECPKCGYTFNR